MSSPKALNRLPSLGQEIASDWKTSHPDRCFSSPTKPTTASNSSTGGSNPSGSPKARQHQGSSRFTFTNRLGGRFYQNNTIMGATQKTIRTNRKTKQKASVWQQELARLHREIDEVLQLEKQARAMKKKRELYILQLKNVAASKFQRAYRLYRILHHRSRRKKKAAAVTLQKLLGTNAQGRAYAKDAKDRINAELLHAVLGGSLTGLDPVAYQRYRQESYAKDIQRWWRQRQQLHLALEQKYFLSVLRIQRVYRGKLGRRTSAKLAEIKARQKLLDMALSGISKKKRGSVFEKCKKESEEKERTLTTTLAVNKAAVAKRKKESGATKSSGTRQKKGVGRGTRGERNGARRRK